MSLHYNTSLIYEKRKGSVDDPFINITDIRKLQTSHTRVLLSETPSQVHTMTIKRLSDNKQYFQVRHDSELAHNQFRVDYNIGFVEFNLSESESEFDINYMGTGAIFFPHSRIWTKEENGLIIETLSDIINSGVDAIEALKKVSQALLDATEATKTANSAAINANSKASLANREWY